MNLGLHTLLSWVTLFCGIYCYYSLAEALLKPRFSSKLVKPAVVSVISLLMATVGLAQTAIPRSMLTFSLYLILPFACFRGKVFQRILCFAFWVVSILCVEMISVAIAPLFGWEPISPSPMNQYILDLLCTVFTIVFYFLIRGVLHLIENRLPFSVWISCTLMALVFLAPSFILVFNSYTYLDRRILGLSSETIHYMNNFGMFLPVISLLALLFFIKRFNNSIRESEQAHFSQAQAQLELDQTKMLLVKDEQYRQLRHDFKNHLLAVDALGQKGEYDRLHEYLASLNAAYVQTEVRSYCAHPLLDSLFDAKFIRMQEAGIESRWNMQPLECEIHISDIDLCALVGNILDNAVNACSQIENGAKRKIDISLQVSKTEFIFRVVNSCKDAKASIEGMSGKARKRSGHGYGLKSVRRIVDQYNGTISAEYTDAHTLSVSIYIPNKA